MKLLVCINQPIETLHNCLLDLVKSSIGILVYFDLEDKITYKSIGIISDNVGINFILGELVINESGIKILGFYFSDINYWARTTSKLLSLTPNTECDF